MIINGNVYIQSGTSSSSLHHNTTEVNNTEASQQNP